MCSWPSKGFPGRTVLKNPPANAGDERERGFDPWVGKIPLELEVATHSSIPAWKTSGAEEPSGLQSMVAKRQTRQTHRRMHAIQRLPLITKTDTKISS